VGTSFSGGGWSVLFCGEGRAGRHAVARRGGGREWVLRMVSLALGTGLDRRGYFGCRRRRRVGALLGCWLESMVQFLQPEFRRPIAPPSTSTSTSLSPSDVAWTAASRTCFEVMRLRSSPTLCPSRRPEPSMPRTGHWRGSMDTGAVDVNNRRTKRAATLKTDAEGCHPANSLFRPDTKRSAAFQHT